MDTCSTIHGTSSSVPIVFYTISSPISTNLMGSLSTPNGGYANATSTISVTNRIRLVGAVRPGVGGLNIVCAAARTGSVDRLTALGTRYRTGKVGLIRGNVGRTSRLRTITISLIGRISTVAGLASGGIISGVDIILRRTGRGNVPVCNSRVRRIGGNYLTSTSVSCITLNRGANRVTISILNNGSTTACPIIAISSSFIIIGPSITSALNVAVPTRLGSTRGISASTTRWLPNINQRVFGLFINARFLHTSLYTFV